MQLRKRNFPANARNCLPQSERLTRIQMSRSLRIFDQPSFAALRSIRPRINAGNSVGKIENVIRASDGMKTSAASVSIARDIVILSLIRSWKRSLILPTGRRPKRSTSAHRRSSVRMFRCFRSGTLILWSSPNVMSATSKSKVMVIGASFAT